jgi:CBS domain containing-hemolysin-like protein
MRDVIAIIAEHADSNAEGEAEPALCDSGDAPNTTIANWVMENLGGVPRIDEQITWRGLCFRVTRVQRHRVMEVNISRA